MNTNPSFSLLTMQLDPRRLAKLLYWQGWSVKRISDELGLKGSTIYSWSRRENWASENPVAAVQATLALKLQWLAAKPVLNSAERADFDVLMRQLERGGLGFDAKESGQKKAQRGAGRERGDGDAEAPKKISKPTKSQLAKLDDAEAVALQAEFCADLAERFETALMAIAYDYQKGWWAERGRRTRNILKSRQIGATYYFAMEAVTDALKTGHNKIFLSASKAQAHIFKKYICDFWFSVTGEELKGNPIILPNRATLYFLSTSARTSQGYHGDVYFDEYMWIPHFAQFRKLAGAMATQKKYKLTFFSTPSTKSHEGYAFFSGADRKNADDLKIDLDDEVLRLGALGEDKQWRQRVDIFDAEKGGCDLFDIKELQEENSDEVFRNLFLCEFIDDMNSVFSFKLLQACQIDVWDAWDDYQPDLNPDRPFGDAPVWVGFDPAYTGDHSALVVIAPPPVGDKKAPFRLLERVRYKLPAFADQAAELLKITRRYNVQYMGIDATGGFGTAVAQLVVNFYPNVQELRYTPVLKQQMILKAQDVVKRKRLLYDLGDTATTASFLAISREVSATGKSMVYKAGRTEEAGHADVAWAIMHCLVHEGMVNGTEIANVAPRGFIDFGD